MSSRTILCALLGSSDEPGMRLTEMPAFRLVWVSMVCEVAHPDRIATVERSKNME